MSPRNWKILTGLLMLALFAVVDAAIRETDPWLSRGAAGSENLDAVVTGLFDTHVLAFEVLGVLLTAAMIGAMVIARPLDGRADADNYPAASAAQMDATRAASSLTTGVYQTTPTPIAPIIARQQAAAAAKPPAPAPDAEETA